MVTVLVCEDHPAMRQMLETTLSTAGIHVVGTVGDGPSALGVAARLHPDVVVTGARMPGFGAEELITQLKAVCPRTLVVVCTSAAAAGQRRQLCRCGAAAVVDKTAGAAAVVDAVLASTSTAA